MKTNKRDLIKQRQLIDKRLRPWLALRADIMPPTGWIKTVRTSLGMTSRQIAQLLGLSQSTISQLEKREKTGNASIELMAKVAKAMNCKLIYAIVPNDEFKSLDAIIDSRAQKIAAELMKKTEHTMRLEAQGTSKEESQVQLDQLAQKLKNTLDSRLWDKDLRIKGKVRR